MKGLPCICQESVIETFLHVFSVSQTQASEEIRGAGLKVIGWYHSHPVFNPNPSVRDMETQLKFQVKKRIIF